MSTYDVTNHTRLSPAAAALDAGALDSYATGAEAVLGIADTAYTGREGAVLTLAVVLQTNRAVALAGRGGGLLSSESKGAQGYTLARNSQTGTVDPVDPEALRLVRSVVGVASWTPAGALR